MSRGQGVPADQTCFAKIVKYKLLYSLELNQISTKLNVFLAKFGMAILFVNPVQVFYLIPLELSYSHERLG